MASSSTSSLAWSISKTIRQRRIELGLSQEELGNRASLHRTYISDIEAGRRNLSLRSLLSLASGLGFSVSDLLQIAESTAAASPEYPTLPEMSGSTPELVK